MISCRLDSLRSSRKRSLSDENVASMMDFHRWRFDGLDLKKASILKISTRSFLFALIPAGTNIVWPISVKHVPRASSDLGWEYFGYNGR
jgi:hypothetical protein